MIGTSIKKLLSICVTTMISFHLNAEEYNCPSVELIKSRDISRDFDWTVSDETTLNQVLNVSELIDVSIENHGEFVGCIYKSDDKIVRLDAKPITVDCLIITSSLNWLINQNGQSVCNDGNKIECKFKINCQIIQDGS